jgi:SAM-dependent methyltransferase
MKGRPANFDRLAAPYLFLERLAFGRDLERARFCYLDRLRRCESILLLGEGDGRCAARLLAAAPGARLHCIDASAAMIARARARVAGDPAAARVTFAQADALTSPWPDQAYDAVVTLFFLDCFTAEEVAGLVGRLGPRLRPGSLWLFADFVLPAGGWRRLRARLWLGLLYFFFRWQTRLSARSLPPSEQLLASAGWREEAHCDRQNGLLRTALFRRPPGPPVTAD